MNTTNTQTGPATAEQLAGNFESDLATTDLARAEALEGLQQVRLAKASHLERQRARLITRVGAEDPRVLELNGVIASNQRLTHGLKLEVDRTKAATVQPDERGWILHGYVRKQDGQGQPGLTVSLYDRSGQWIPTLSYACTDENGYFKLSYHQSSEKETDAMAFNVDSEAFIRVSDQKRKVLATDKTPVKLELGRVEYREIILNGECDNCQPPSDPSSKEPPTSAKPAAKAKSRKTPASKKAPGAKKN
jgi:hypothetical protein